MLSRKKDEEEVDPEQLRKDMERLQLLKEKRCAAAHWVSHACSGAWQTRGACCRENDRLRRIKEEGWDRYAPPSATNKKCAGCCCVPQSLGLFA